ncbi:hypothetical protein GOBAR_DD27450 [Gossypium barbadense]|nr:hypothetical protein GOBAR_DD27450 [Gossypium barbadense]
MRFNRNVSFDDMKEMISAKTVRHCGRKISKLFYKFLVSTDPINFTEMELVDDEDMETMIALYCGNQSDQNTPIHLFVELAGVEPNKDLTAYGEEHRAQEPFENQIRRIVIPNNLGAHMSLIDPDVAHVAEFSEYPEILPAHRLVVNSDLDELFVG